METINKLTMLMHLCINKGIAFSVNSLDNRISMFVDDKYESSVLDKYEPIECLILKVQAFNPPSEDEIKQAKIEALQKELNELTK